MKGIVILLHDNNIISSEAMNKACRELLQNNIQDLEGERERKIVVEQMEW